MKKHINIILSFAVLAFTAEAQNKFDAPAREMLQSFDSHIAVSDKNKAPSQQYVCAIVTLTDASYSEDFKALGYEIYDLVDDLVLTDIPLADAPYIAKLDFIKHISFGGKSNPLLDIARRDTNVDILHNGEGLNMPYTGKDVVTALFDTGLDPNHINFNGTSGNSRVKAIATVMGSQAKMTTYETKRSISSFSTENNNENHGTHVLGIMSGSYNGEGLNAGTTGNLPYKGVAPESDIIVTCGDLYNNNILKGVRYAIDKAKEMGKPAVINLSIGSTVGPHDGSDSFSRLLDSYGEEAIIVVAAGNDGDVPMGIRKEFTTDDNKIQTFLLPYVSTSTGISNVAETFDGQVDFYSSENKPFKFSVVVYNRIGSKIVGRYDLDTSTSGAAIQIGGSGCTNVELLEGLDKACSSTSRMALSSNVSTDNDRYSVNISFSLNMASSTTTYYLGFIIEGEPGQVITGYANAYNTSTTGVYASFSNRSRIGWDDGSANGSISSLACGKNVITLGSYTTRKSWPVLNGGTYTYTGNGFTVNDVTGFSSYGTLSDGRDKPDLCAPGAAIISSYNTYYLTAHPSEQEDMTASTSNGSKNYYWGHMQGTSMSSPFAAGVFALWLEADPTLTVDKIRQIAVETASKDSFVETGDPVKWGAGKIDALAGIKKVLDDKASVGAIFADDARNFIVTPVDGGYNVYVGGEREVAVTVYDMSGRDVAQAAADDNTVDVATVHLAKGVYILTAQGNTQRHSTKIVVK